MDFNDQKKNDRAAPSNRKDIWSENDKPPENNSRLGSAKGSRSSIKFLTKITGKAPSEGVLRQTSRKED